MKAIGVCSAFFPYHLSYIFSIDRLIWKQASNKSNGDDDDAFACIVFKSIRFPFEYIAFHCFPYEAKKCLRTIEKETESDFLLLFPTIIRKLITFDAHPKYIITFTPEIPYFSFHFYRWKKRRQRQTEHKRNAKAHLVRVCFFYGKNRAVSFSGKKMNTRTWLTWCRTRKRIRDKRSKAQTNALYADTNVSVNIYLWLSCKVEHVCALHPFFGSRSKDTKQTLLHDSPSFML